MSRLILGTVQFGLPYGIANEEGQVSRTVAKNMLDLARSQNINMLDTAINYGESEICLGEIGCEGFNLITKLPLVPDNCTDVSLWLQMQVESSLNRLGVNSLYGVLLHDSSQLIGMHGKVIYESLQNLKKLGYVEKIGVSIYSPHELDELFSQFSLDLVQAPFNLVDRRLQTSGWLNRLKDNGVEVHIRSVFLQGLLLMERYTIPSKFEEWSELWNKWHKWLAHEHISAVEACLSFTLSFPDIERIVVGAENVIQLEQIINAERRLTVVDFPDLHCNAENLINPSYWPHL